jgi:hypothetical protein
MRSHVLALYFAPVLIGEAIFNSIASIDLTNFYDESAHPRQPLKPETGLLASFLTAL